MTKVKPAIKSRMMIPQEVKAKNKGMWGLNSHPAADLLAEYSTAAACDFAVGIDEGW